MVLVLGDFTCTHVAVSINFIVSGPKPKLQRTICYHRLTLIQFQIFFNLKHVGALT